MKDVLRTVTKCERMFSELGDLLEPRRRILSLEMLAAIQCVRRWRRAHLGDDKIAGKHTVTDKEIELKYGIYSWDDSNLNTMLISYTN
jgi:hypothetical protein